MPLTPYYRESGITIYCGDCRYIAPALGMSFDLLLTDPPYGIGRDGSKRSTGSHGGRKAYEFLGWDSEPPHPWLLGMLCSLAEKQIIWGGNYFAGLTPSMKWLVWDKGQRIDQSDGELAWTNLEGALRIYTCNRVELMKDGADHPAQKPEVLFRWCIQQADPVTTIIDPFAGVGTTGIAAKELRRQAVLIERQERYCEIAAKRLSQEVLDFSGASI